MLKKGFLKPELTVAQLGKQRFWIGLSMGIYITIALVLITNVSREAFRFITFHKDFLIFEPEEFHSYDLFFAALSASLGFSATIIYWFVGQSRIVKKRYLLSYSMSNTAFVAILSFSIIARFGTNLAIAPYSFYGYDNHLNFLSEFKLLLILIPIYIFMNNWQIIQLVFKSNKWLTRSIVLFMTMSILIFLFLKSDREVLNQAYQRHNKQKFEYINREIERAKEFEVYISDSVKQILTKKYAERTVILLTKLKSEFSNANLVSLENLFLEKILIHNLNSRMLIGGYNEYNWPYAMPDSIYYQICKHNINSPEVQLLFEILAEQTSIFSAPTEIPYDQYYEYSRNEREKSRFKQMILINTNTVQSRLFQVVEKLQGDTKYQKYHRYLKKFEFDNYRKQQEFYPLFL